MHEILQVYLAAGGRDETFHNSEWREMFLAVEVIVHYKYNETRITPKKITKRKDYDIALIRIDYPVIDDDSGNYNYSDHNY